VEQHLAFTTDQRHHLATKAFRGVELVEEVARLVTMKGLLGLEVLAVFGLTIVVHPSDLEKVNMHDINDFLQAACF
jgi:hypothetical protein